MVESSSCMTHMERYGPENEDLYIAVTMPCLQVGTVGGGADLTPQGCCLNLLGVGGPNLEFPGANSRKLAEIICCVVLAGELSLMAALAAGQLTESHLRLNRAPDESSESSGQNKSEMDEEPQSLVPDLPPISYPSFEFGPCGEFQ